jgi:hypothetical protein
LTCRPDDVGEVSHIQTASVASEDMINLKVVRQAIYDVCGACAVARLFRTHNHK